MSPEVIVGAISILVGFFFSGKGTLRILRERKAAKVLGLKGRTPEWAILQEKTITEMLIAFGLILMAAAIVLVLSFDSPRPEPVRQVITWSIVAMPLIFGLLATHTEVSYMRTSEIIQHYKNGNGTEE